MVDVITIHFCIISHKSEEKSMTYCEHSSLYNVRQMTYFSGKLNLIDVWIYFIDLNSLDSAEPEVYRSRWI